MMKKVLIIEDNADQLMALKKLTEEVDTELVVYTAINVEKAYQIAMEQNIDIFMVDIILFPAARNDVSGVRFVERLRNVKKYMFTPVIFITSLEDPQMYAYKELNCLDYIEKPFDPEHVRAIIKKALLFPQSDVEDDTIIFRQDGILWPVKVKDIVYIENCNHAIYLHMTDGRKQKFPYKTFKQILNEVNNHALLQCSRSVIINCTYLVNIDFVNQYISMKGCKESIGIGLTYRKRLMERFYDH